VIAEVEVQLMSRNPIIESSFRGARSLVALTLFLSATFLTALSFAGTSADVTNPYAAQNLDIRKHQAESGLSIAARSRGEPLSAPSGPGWSIVTSPNLSSTRTNELFGVTCSSDSDCWAAGNFSGPTGQAQTLLVRWTGQSWTAFPSPNNSGSNSLQSVTCASSGDCWAVGNFFSGNLETLIEHWDGASWSIVSSPNPDPSYSALYDVACSSSASCWAVGYYSGGGVIEHWDSASWSIVSSGPSTQVGELYGVTCSAPNQCWAVGAGPSGPAIEQWNGISWSLATSPPLGGYLFDVSCISVNQCFAVGGNGGAPFIEQWNGTSWSVINPPRPAGATNTYLVAITCNSSTCWAAGDYITTAGLRKTLVEQWDGNSWQIITSPSTQTPPNDAVFAVTCSSTSRCWTVGATSPDPQNFSVSKTLIEEYGSSIPPLISASSRMAHGGAGTFDIDLPLTGAIGIESRSGNGIYSVIFSFVNNVSNCGTAATVGGTVVSGPNANQCTMNLTGIADAQTLNVGIDNVVDSLGNTGNVSVKMGVLIGDVSGDGFVNVGDTILIRNHSGETISASNCRFDVNADGVVNVGDTVLVRSHSGDFLP
jgi:Dockerin type I domain